MTDSSLLNLTRAEAATRSANVRTTDYQVALDLRTAPNEPEAGFATRTTLTFDAEPGSATFLDFVGRSVQSVELNGELIDVNYNGARIALPRLAAHNTVSVTGTAEYSRSGEGLHRFVDPADQKVYLYTQYEPADARRVFANFEQPDLKARYSFSVIAPSNWAVASNGALTSQQPVDGAPELREFTFAQTQPISTYITCVIAGEYRYFSSRWDSEQHAEGADLGVYVRESLAEHTDAENLFDLTRAGLEYFHGKFGFEYPFGKYDQAFVPEYNLGAMENPGLVTFTDNYIFSSAATDAQRQGRANTLMHEMAHMWFGDLVTMKWWDDLWLKESFADYMGTLAVAEATNWGDASWVSFANRRKAWAYVQDQLPTTHPIVADIVDLEAAKQNFDGITYAKGASVLKQLVAYVGPEAFFAAARAYFQEHQYSNTTVNDFLGALSAASGRDMAAWSQQWLQTAGISTLSARVEAAEGKLSSVTAVQEAVDPRTGESNPRPHQVKVAGYRRSGDALKRIWQQDAEIGPGETELRQLAGLEQPDLLLMNDRDLTYAKIRFDDRSLDALLTSLDKLEDPLAKSLALSQLWNMTRDAALPAVDLVGAVLRFAPAETDDGVLTVLLEQAVTAVKDYAPAAAREELWRKLAQAAKTALNTADGGAALAWARHLCTVARYYETALEPVSALLTTGTVPVDVDLRWRALFAQAAWGTLSEQSRQEALSLDQGAVATLGAERCIAAEPTSAVKETAWNQIYTDSTLSNDHIDARIQGFNAGAAPLHDAFAQRYFDSLLQTWNGRSIEIASRIVKGLFPSGDVTDAMLDAGSQPSVERAQGWLDSHPDAPGALRRLLLEAVDNEKRKLRAQLAV